MAIGTKITGGQKTFDKGGILKDKNDKKTTPNERLKSSSVKFGSFIDKRSGK